MTTPCFPASLTVPSGRTLTREELHTIELMVQYGSVRWVEQPYQLKCGLPSNLVVDGRADLTMHLDLLTMVGRQLAYTIIAHMDSTGDTRTPRLIGIPTAGTAIAQSAAQVAYLENLRTASGQSIVFLGMRSFQKLTHGDKPKYVDAPYDAQYFDISVDNVVTDGGSKNEFAQNISLQGFPGWALGHYVWVDRCQGGPTFMRQDGHSGPILIGFLLTDIAYACEKLQLPGWGAGSYDRAKRELNEVAQALAARRATNATAVRPNDVSAST